jgi:hypothetical protein
MRNAISYNVIKYLSCQLTAPYFTVTQKKEYILIKKEASFNFIILMF